jgi:hypothetical protein
MARRGRLHGPGAPAPRRTDRWRWLAAGLATVVVSGANPNGFGALAAVLRYRQSPLQASLIEWSPASLWGSPYAFDLLLYAAALAMILLPAARAAGRLAAGRERSPRRRWRRSAMKC